MSVKKEASGRRSVQVEIEVPGTPEEVWRAIATGPGISSWFVPTTCDEREGGQVISNFGPGMECPADITAWEAPNRFVAEGLMGAPGSPTVATEWTVEARAGDKCIVRVVHSLFASTDDWDNQLDGLEQGWPAYFRVLQLYLENFRGKPCSAMQVVSFSKEPEVDVWRKAGVELGFLDLAVGQPWSAPDGLPQLSGVVDMLGKGMHPNTVLIRLDAPAPGTAFIGAFSCGGIVQMYMAIYLYGDDARATVERDEPAWRKWMEDNFPMPDMG